MNALKLIPAILVLAACANAGVVQVAPDTYLLSKQDNAGIFGNFARFKTEVIQEANDFATGKGKVAIPVTMNETPAGPGRFATFQYQFRLVDASDPTAQRVTLTRQPDVLIESTSRSTADVNLRTPPAQSTDLYAELLKLDDLRKRGILTEAEFGVQKTKLLEQKRP
ncbi:SHOCT domain-containing protein [Hydrogenophaga sp. D2P1]|uniref:SHOCT domain-containing protein n=1 Tax=Hydrogenophaga aromaticivorans TaxID=2610898 RepID=A0A7Y8GZY6_9BURK|nr:SHOCT domain-containing protein [Hydrogenophaga aromaticivorans]NWF47947.1 SHOCT domain-containing protein [Hydrogenophaga aromaticivorans]